MNKASMVNIDKLIDRINDIANQDDKITEEEARLLDTVRGFVDQYNVYLEITEEDGVVDEEEKAKLKEMRKWILEGAWVDAAENGIISTDESNILSEIYEFFKELKI